MRWRDSLLGRRLGVRLSIIQAPMAGGSSTVRLAAVVSEVGGLGSVAGGLLSPEDLRAAVRDVRALTDRPFAVNLFATLPEPSLSRAQEWAELTGARPVTSTPLAPRFEDQLAVVIAERVPVFSFTFGMVGWHGPCRPESSCGWSARRQPKCSAGSSVMANSPTWPVGTLPRLCSRISRGAIPKFRRNARLKEAESVNPCRPAMSVIVDRLRGSASSRAHCFSRIMRTVSANVCS